MKQSLKDIDNLFVNVLNDCERFACLARAKQFQVESCKRLEDLMQLIADTKNEAVDKNDEESANRFLYYQLVTQTLINELQMWIAFKEDRPEDAWDYLVHSQTSLSGALNAFDVGDLLEPYVEKLSLLEELLFPKMLFSSVGIKATKKTCSICSQDYDSCDHIKGKPYMGSLCTAIIEKCDLEEISIVEEPANKHCRLTTLQEKGVTRNLMTWEVVQKDKTEGNNKK